MTIYRPWGTLWLLIHTKHFWLKIIHVHKHHRTSLQYHYFRTEYHISKRGIRKIVPIQEHHMTSGWYIEIATGLPTEDDIVRLVDDYNRH